MIVGLKGKLAKGGRGQMCFCLLPEGQEVVNLLVVGGVVVGIISFFFH